MYILWEASSEEACPFFLSEGWNIGMMAGFGAAVLELEVETDEDSKVTI